MQNMHKMKPKTPIPVVKVDYTKKAWEQTTTALHNRWHPDLPAVRTTTTRDMQTITPHSSMQSAASQKHLHVHASMCAPCIISPLLACRRAGGLSEGRRRLPGGNCRVDRWPSSLLWKSLLACLMILSTAYQVSLTFARLSLTLLQTCAGGQINNDDSAEDVKTVDLTKVAISHFAHQRATQRITFCTSPCLHVTAS